MSDPNSPTPAPGNQPPAPQPAYGEYAPPAPPAADSAPAYAAPAYQAAPAYSAGPAANGSYPGKTLGIVALVLAIVPVGLQLVGLILGIVALVQSRKAGQKNGIALAAIIVSGVLLVLTIIGIILAVALFNAAGGADLVNQVNACLNDPTGNVVVNGITVTCEEILEQSGR
ncbi:DUF4190 domain-containing protein [Microbacterium aurum]